MGRRRRLSEEERKLWLSVTESVTPLHPERVRQEPEDVAARGARSAPATEKAQARAKSASRPVAAASPPAPPPPPEPAIQTRPLNRQWALALRRGTVAVDASLDLHGLTEDAAHRALLRFIASARAARLRTVLVVTGKGREGRGILKARLPQWLAQGSLRDEVLALYPAHVKDGGGGAWYVVLRRPRDDRVTS